MTITIQSTGVQLDLPMDIKLNIEENSPFFSNAGAISLPVSLPLTSKNRRALNFPDRLDIYDLQEDAVREIKDIAVLVTQGRWQELGAMSISGSSQSAVEATIYFKDSSIWSLLEDLSLPQIMADMHYGDIPEIGADLSVFRTNLFNTLNEDFSTYPAVFTNLREWEQGISYTDWADMLEKRAAWLKTRDFIIAPVHTEDGWLNRIFYPGALARTDNFTYITAFLRLDYVLHKIFEKIGHELTIDFDSFPQANPDYNTHFEEQWHAIVLLNNTMDALYPGYLPYNTLVPEISCKEFLLAVRAQFGCAFILQPDGSVKMTFSETCLSSPSVVSASLFSGLQVSFNTKPDYTPADDIEKSEQATAVFLRLPDTEHDSSYVSPPGAEDTYPYIHTLSLEGVCQRTTFTTIDGEDSTKSTKCLLVFATIDFAAVEYIDYDRDEHEIRLPATYPAIRKQYIELLRLMEQVDGQDIISDIVPWYFSAIPKDSLYQRLNTTYNAIAESCDRITISKVMTKSEIANFDFGTALLINGRLCYPVKLQYELTNGDTQTVSMELIAPRKIM